MSNRSRFRAPAPEAGDQGRLPADHRPGGYAEVGSASPRAVVIGDAMVDIYLDADAVGLSDEAPVVVVDWRSESARCGGMLNVARSLAAAGFATVDVVGLADEEDEPGQFVCGTVNRDPVLRGHWFSEPGRPTTSKTRIVVDGRDHLARVDREDVRPIEAPTEAAILERLSVLIRGAAVVVVSDYAKGLFTRRLARELIQLARERGAPVIVDAKPGHLGWFAGADLFTPNLDEAAAFLSALPQRETPPGRRVSRGPAEENRTPDRTDSSTIGDDGDASLGLPADAPRHLAHRLASRLGRDAGARLLAHLGPQESSILVTLGSEGMLLYERGGSAGGVRTSWHHALSDAEVVGAAPQALTDSSSSARPTTVQSTSGAGDVVLAVMATAFLGSVPTPFRDLLPTASRAVARAIRRPGTVCLEPTDLTA